MPQTFETLTICFSFGKSVLPKSPSKSESPWENSGPGWTPWFTFHLQSEIMQECQKFNRAFSSDNLVLEGALGFWVVEFSSHLSFHFPTSLPSSVHWLLSATAVQITGLSLAWDIYIIHLSSFIWRKSNKDTILLSNEIFKAAFSPRETGQKTPSMIYVSTKLFAYQSMCEFAFIKIYACFPPVVLHSTLCINM